MESSWPSFWYSIRGARGQVDSVKKGGVVTFRIIRGNMIIQIIVEIA